MGQKLNKTVTITHTKGAKIESSGERVGPHTDCYCSNLDSAEKGEQQKKSIRLIPLIIVGGILISNDLANAEEAKPLGQINDYLRVTGELQGRYEAWDYFQPSPAVNNNNDYDFWALRARLGVLLTTSFVDGYAQAQYTGIYGLPNNAVAVPGGSLGIGGGLFFGESVHVS